MMFIYCSARILQLFLTVTFMFLLFGLREQSLPLHGHDLINLSTLTQWVSQHTRQECLHVGHDSVFAPWVGRPRLGGLVFTCIVWGSYHAWDDACEFGIGCQVIISLFLDSSDLVILFRCTRLWYILWLKDQLELLLWLWGAWAYLVILVWRYERPDDLCEESEPV